jgi:hypothetical protein
MGFFPKTDSFSAWNKHVFVESDPSIGIREADVCKHTEGIVLSLFEVDGVQVDSVVICVSLSQSYVERRRSRVYTIGIIVKGCSLVIFEGDGRITVRSGLTECLKDFQYLRHAGGQVICGDRAPVDALFDDDRSVTSVEQFVRRSVDGRVCSRPIVECGAFHWFMKPELGCSVAVQGNASGRKRGVQDHEDQMYKKRRFAVPVSCPFQYDWKYVYYYL